MIEIIHLTKRYGYRTAVDDLNLTVMDGDIFGFVGPNGAGKTSTIRMMATLIQPDDGDIQIAGHSIQTAPRDVRRVIGYMPDVFGVYPDTTVWEYLEFFAACYDIPPVQRRGLISDLLELVDLSHRIGDMVESLSRGMKQRLALARTLIHDPRVLVLDEPASGLDPRARVEIRALLVELSRMGKTIFFSTHILADVAEICTRVGIIEAGQLVTVGPLEDLQKRLVLQRQIQVTVIGTADASISQLQNVPDVRAIKTLSNQGNAEHTRLEILFEGNDLALSQLLAGLVSAGVRVLHFSEVNQDLEEVFLRATKGLVT